MGGLFNSTVLDVAIGLLFVYLLLGILCTTVHEWIAGIVGTRANTLRQGIRGLLDGQSTGTMQFLEAFYLHPVISGMMKDGKHPSYLSSRTFSTAIMDLVTPTISGPITLPNLVDGINALPEGEVKKTLVALVTNVGGDLGKAQRNIEHWFDDAMDRVSGWYKRSAQLWTAIIAVALTISANADTMKIARQLWANPTVRSELIDQAKTTKGSQTPVGLTAQEDTALGGVLGWNGSSLAVGGSAWLERILGWIFTTIAVSLGAPFWFDTLNRFINIRSAGKPPDPTD
jgi:hypothetical protein